jgi:ferredoxin
MLDPVYRELARTLDGIPPGLPATESGVELQLLARLYTREEAALVSVMRLNYEVAGDIAARVGMDSAAAQEILDDAARKGLVRVQTRGNERRFALKPTMGGLAGYGYREFLLGAEDLRAAELHMQWIRETRGGNISEAPASRRVIPVEESIPHRLTIHPYEQASGMLARAKSWGVIDCNCRARKRQAGQGCDYPLETCLAIAPDEGAFEEDELIRPISYEESLRILRESAESGLIHTTGNISGDPPFICNCCPCCCPTMRGVVEFHRPTAVAHSDFCATVEATACVGCGDCIDRCHFGALSLRDGLCAVDPARCMGCGLCAVACAFDALSLVRRPEGETPPSPADLDEWMDQHTAHRRAARAGSA